MSSFSKGMLYWLPRGLSIAFLAFLSLFALDVFNEHLGFGQTVAALFTHLIPVFGLAAVLALAWRWEWVGAVLFAAAGLQYTTRVLSPSRHLDPAVKLNWILVIAAPAFVIAALFLANWIRRKDLRAGGR